MPEARVDLRRLVWAAPITVLGAVVAVLLVRAVSLLVLELPPEGFQPLGWFFPIFDTVVLVSAAVLVFALVARLSRTPARTYWWIALAALALSMVPDLLMHTKRPNLFTWPRTVTLMIMHVAAWWVTVTLLTRLTACSKSVD